ncbi:MAG: alpha/beta fold hydrolase [Micromonosporaceae bacterium]|nr:alpha/beta fold hydrolase [Micromonosporaceae bacterium]
MRPFRARLQVALFAAAALAAAAITTSASPASAAVRDPIVFVHGYNGSASNWNTMVSRFRSDGYAAGELHTWNYNSSQSNTAIARQLATYVSQVRSATDATTVDIVGHSMGGLNSRQYLKFEGGTTHVDDWVSLGSPHHGTQWAYGCFTVPCVEMRPGSTFLNSLNAGDETPGGVSYGSWWSPCDELIEPERSPVLSGAKNTQTACIGHTAFLTDATVYGQVRDFVA